MSASMAGNGILAFRGNSFHAARQVARSTLRPPQQPPASMPQLVSVTGIGSVPDAGAWLSPDSDAAYGDVLLRLGLNQQSPYVIVIRFPGTSGNTGAPADAGGLFVAGAGLAIVQTAVAGQPTDLQWSCTATDFGALDSQRVFAIHYEWNNSH